MELFAFSANVGAGLPLWLPKGAALRVGGDVAVLKFGNQLAFVDFAAVAEEFQGVGS